MRATHRIVVVGAGYGGLMAANRIAAARGVDVAVTLINPRADFVERIRLHQLAAGTATATIPLEHLVHRAAEVRIDAVDLIGEHDVLLSSGVTLGYDHLVYAVGSHGSARPKDAYGVADLESAQRLRQRLVALPAGAPVTVVGGGLTGIETSAEIAEAFPEHRVALAARTIGAGLPTGGRAKVMQRLERLGVELRLGAGVATTDSACTVWASGFDVPDLAQRSGLAVDECGRLLTDETLTSTSNLPIVGVGDAVAPPPAVGSHLRMSCQAALPLGAHGADTVLARLRGVDPTPLSLGFAGQAVSLGRRSAVVAPSRSDGSPRGTVFSGRPAALLKEMVCRTTVLAPKHFPGAYRWLPGPTVVSDRREKESSI